MTPKQTDLRALALILADEANQQGVLYQAFSFAVPVLDLPEGDYITVTVRRSKAAERVNITEWLHIGSSVPAGVEA